MKTSHALGAMALACTIALPAAAADEAVLHRFRGTTGGATPQVPLVADGTGTVYGTTWAGGANGAGTVYSLTVGSDGTIAEQVLYSFAGNGDGAHPQSSVSFDADGNLYGTTSGGGGGDWGTVYELVRPTSPGGAWQEKILYAFNGDDGGSPHGMPVFGPDGALYGTTYFGGPQFAGNVYRLARRADGSWAEQVLYDFSGGADGSAALSDLVIDRAGNLYGTTIQGGPAGHGVVFKLSPPAAGHGAWTETVLYGFDGPSDGAQPQTGVIFDRQGNMYGTTVVGGTMSYGTVFKLTPPAEAGQPWVETVLHNFSYNIEGTPGLGLPLLDDDGTLLGTSAGGTHLMGSIWRLVPPSQQGGAWTYTDLYDFSGGADGSGPGGGLLKVGPRRYIGATEEGGTHRSASSLGNGTVYMIQR